MVTLGNLLKGMGLILLLPFLLPATWNVNVMAGALAPVMGLEVTYTIGAICQHAGQAILKI